MKKTDKKVIYDMLASRANNLVNLSRGLRSTALVAASTGIEEKRTYIRMIISRVEAISKDIEKLGKVLYGTDKTVAEVRSIRDALIPEIKEWRKMQKSIPLFTNGRVSAVGSQKLNEAATKLSGFISDDIKKCGLIISSRDTRMVAKELYFICVSFIYEQFKEMGQRHSIETIVGDTYFCTVIEERSLPTLLEEFNEVKQYGCGSAGLLNNFDSLANEALSIIALSI